MAHEAPDPHQHCVKAANQLQRSVMKTKDGRKIIEQNLSVRSRLRFERREAELFERLGAIEASFGDLEPDASELLRYYPTA